jgi:hypothetical protein
MMTWLGEGAPETCMAGTFHSHGSIALAITIAGVIGAALSLMRAITWLREQVAAARAGHRSRDWVFAKGWLLGVWLLVPPAWLFVEDIFLFRAFGKADCFGQFQYAQHLVLTGWIVFVLALGALLFGREIVGKD